MLHWNWTMKAEKRNNQNASAPFAPRSRFALPVGLKRRTLPDDIRKVDLLACVIWLRDGCPANRLDQYRQEVALQLWADAEHAEESAEPAKSVVARKRSNAAGFPMTSQVASWAR
jgi:hypothetical protein